MSVKVLVTGATGFIGKSLVPYLASFGYNVFGIDCLPLDYNDPRFAHLLVDILDYEELLVALQKIKPLYVIHLAAETSLCSTKGLEFYNANTLGVSNLIAAIQAVGGVQRVLFTSSQLVCAIGYQPVHECDYFPSTLYGYSKMIGEQAVRKAILTNLTWAILRPTTIWGEGMSLHYQKFFRLVSEGRYFHVGRSCLYKSYGYIGNTIYQYRRFLEAPDDSINKRTFYIADYVPLSLRYWADLIAQSFDRTVPTLPRWIANLLAISGDFLNLVGFKSFPFNSFRLKNILTEYQFDLSSTESICGPLPFSVDEGVVRTCTWFKAAKS